MVVNITDPDFPSEVSEMVIDAVLYKKLRHLSYCYYASYLVLTIFGIDMFLHDNTQAFYILHCNFTLNFLTIEVPPSSMPRAILANKKPFMVSKTLEIIGIKHYMIITPVILN